MNLKRGKNKSALKRVVPSKNVDDSIQASKNRRLPYLIAILFYLVVSVILLPPKEDPHVVYQVGDVASRSIKAPSDFSVVNEKATALLKKAARQKVTLIFDHNLDIDKMQLTELKAVFDFGQRLLVGSEIKQVEDLSVLHEEKKESTVKDSQVKPDFSKLINRFNERFPDLLAEKDVYRLLKMASIENFEEYSAFKNNMTDIISRLTTSGIMADKNLFVEDVPKILEIQEPGSTHPVELVNVLDFNEARAKAREILKDIYGQKPAIYNLAQGLINKILKPNLVFNRSIYRVRQKEAEAAVKPIEVQIKKDEMIVREGDRVTERQHMLLVALKTAEKNINISSILGRLMVVAFLLLITLAFIHKYQPEFLEPEKLTIIAIGVVLALLTVKGFKQFNLFVYAAPVAFLSILLAVLLNAQVAVLVTFMASIFASVILDNDFMAMLLFSTSGLVGIYTVSNLRQRLSIVKTGLYVSLANVLMIMALFMLESPIISLEKLSLSSWGVLSGSLAVAFASLLLPLFESAFSITTDVKLLELSDLNLPLLSTLSREAPGTYHHSIVVGNLAEAAADAIGANSLLARVGSYYHDIGKMRKATYFAENNIITHPHEKLRPNMSSLILASHVKEGVELAREYKLPKVIEDIVRQHHGTSCITFFYHRAIDEDIHDQVNEDDFRYSGPKPQTKEAAIVMLADGVEAASRTLKEPTLPNIRNLVKKIINSKQVDEQFAECNLTFYEIKVIAEVFERVLVGILHPRVEYPTFDFNAAPNKNNKPRSKEKNEADSKQQPKYPQDRYPQDRENGKGNLAL